MLETSLGRVSEMLMHQTIKAIQDSVRPVVCCECGVRPKESGECQLRKAGWQGFSRLKRERLGMCPKCVADQAATAGR